MTWVADSALIFLALVVLILASMIQSGRWLRLGLIFAGALILWDALGHDRGLAVAAGSLMLLLVNLLSLARSSGWQHKLDEEADAFYQRHLSRLSRAEARLLIDQGSFIEARAGEELTREGAPVGSLHFLVKGVAAVLVDDVIVGRLGPGDLIGEACLLPDGRASATVRLADDRCRLWFIPKERLNALLAAQPQIAAQLNAATTAALRDKLERSNKERSAEV